MTVVLLTAAARVDATGHGGVLTLIFPLVLVPITAVIWAAWWRRRSRDY